MVESACGAQSLVLAKIADGHVGVVSAAVFDDIAEDGLVVVADDEDFFDFGNLSDGGEAMGDDCVAGNREERLEVVRMVGRS